MAAVYPIAWYPSDDFDAVMHSIGGRMFAEGLAPTGGLSVRCDRLDEVSFDLDVSSAAELANLSRIESLWTSLGGNRGFKCDIRWAEGYGVTVSWSIRIPRKFEDTEAAHGHVTGLAGIPVYALLHPPGYVLCEVYGADLSPTTRLAEEMKSDWSGEAWLPNRLVDRLSDFEDSRFKERERLETENGAWFYWASSDRDLRRRAAEWLAPQLRAFAKEEMRAAGFYDLKPDPRWGRWK